MDNSEIEKEHMFNRIKFLYGDRLNEEQLEAVKENIDTVLKNLEQIRSIQLENKDEPYTVFQPYEKELK
jgi:Asp-tRNA(Asn)/Glu-tRNA(Gln) amidotransferase C subunit